MQKQAETPMNHFLIKESDELGKKTFQTEKLFGKLFSNLSLSHHLSKTGNNGSLFPAEI